MWLPCVPFKAWALRPVSAGFRSGLCPRHLSALGSRRPSPGLCQSHRLPADGCKDSVLRDAPQAQHQVLRAGTQPNTAHSFSCSLVGFRSERNWFYGVVDKVLEQYDLSESVLEYTPHGSHVKSVALANRQMLSLLGRLSSVLSCSFERPPPHHCLTCPVSPRDAQRRGVTICLQNVPRAKILAHTRIPAGNRKGNVLFFLSVAGFCLLAFYFRNVYSHSSVRLASSPLTLRYLYSGYCRCAG